jgi:serine/threonine protein kinase
MIGVDEGKVPAKLYDEQRIDFEKLESIGRGAFGEVYKLNRRLAVKKLPPVPKNEAKRVLRELKNWSEIGWSPRLIRLEGLTFQIAYIDGMIEFGFVMPLYDSTLKEYLHTNPNLRFEERLEVLCKVSDGLSALHRHNIIHRFLHSKNVLVKSQFSPKIVISDFGMSKLLQVDCGDFRCDYGDEYGHV